MHTNLETVELIVKQEYAIEQRRRKGVKMAETNHAKRLAAKDFWQIGHRGNAQSRTQKLENTGKWDTATSAQPGARKSTQTTPQDAGRNYCAFGFARSISGSVPRSTPL
jgi:hypothetical protein